MKVTAIQTHKITAEDTDILAVLNSYLPKLEEGSIVAVTSKIVAICEGRIVPIGEIEKDNIIKQEADLYIPREENAYGFIFTVVDQYSLMVPSAGIDESNANGVYVLWPKNAQESANKIRKHLCQQHGIKRLGVIITDSTSRPFRWGVTGVALCHSGFRALNDYRGTQDLFGRTLKVSQANVMDGLAATAVLAMGEGSEQTPLAIIEDASFVQFQDHNPTQEELAALRITVETDLYGSIIKHAPWQKGGKQKNV